MRTPTIRGAGRSDRGRVRRTDEDAFWVDPEAGLFAVADGVGGNQAGEVASRIAVETAARLVAESGYDGRGTSLISSIFSAADAEIRRQAGEDSRRQGMATTLVLFLCRERRGWIAHCGDSRAYLWRKDELRRLTRDHSMAASFEAAGGGGLFSTSPLAHALTRCLGKNGGAEPEIQSIEILGGDRVLLCCDGLTDMVSENGIARVLAESLSPDETCRALVDRANDAGGLDNITTVLAEFGPGGDP